MIKKRFVVTKQSDDETFLVGDHIIFNDDGSITCIEAQGWIDKEDVESASIGMKCVEDREYIENLKKKLKEELNNLE